MEIVVNVYITLLILEMVNVISAIIHVMDVRILKLIV